MTCRHFGIRDAQGNDRIQQFGVFPHRQSTRKSYGGAVGDGKQFEQVLVGMLKAGTTMWLEWHSRNNDFAFNISYLQGVPRQHYDLLGVYSISIKMFKN